MDTLLSNQPGPPGTRGRTRQVRGLKSLGRVNIRGTGDSSVPQTSRWCYIQSHPSSNSAHGYKLLFLWESTCKPLSVAHQTLDSWQYRAERFCWVQYILWPCCRHWTATATFKKVRFFTLLPSTCQSFPLLRNQPKPQLCGPFWLQDTWAGLSSENQLATHALELISGSLDLHDLSLLLPLDALEAWNNFFLFIRKVGLKSSGPDIWLQAMWLWSNHLF